ncbi:MAG: MBL fold metallo-hydrolase [Ruminococcaceae bacterium]|nr:MBL fold metallo-hydrolase [Oscillospiraceae bacterium]
MLKLCTLASGSNGNCTYISDGKTNILIDTGISATRIIRELSMLSVGISAIDAIFITHEHGDHICGLEKLLARHETPVYASPGTARGIGERIECLYGKINTALPGDVITIGDMKITSFHTPHDTYESVGYRIENEGATAAVATDIGHMEKEILERILGVDLLLLECNYDKDRIRHSRYPAFLKSRIVGGSGHLSNNECAETVLRVVQSGTKNIVLGHLSAENNTPREAYTAVHTHLTNNGIIPGVDVMLTVAPRGERGNIITVGE